MTKNLVHLFNVMHILSILWDRAW